MFKRPIASFVVIAAGAAGLSLASPAMADWKQIVNYDSRLCLGVQGGIMQPGQPLVQWQCNGNPDQAWWVPTSPAGEVVIANGANPGYCISVTDSSPGSQLVIQPCYGTGWAGYWNVNAFNQGGDNALVLQQWGEDLVAADAAASPNWGSAIIQWADQIGGAFSHTEQQWLFEEQNVTFHFSSRDGVGDTAGGNITFYFNGNYSVSGGELTINEENLDHSYNFVVNCPYQSALPIDWSWSTTIDGNAFQHPTCQLNGSGNSYVIGADWTAIKNVWQQSNQLNCYLSVTTYSGFVSGSDSTVLTSDSF